MPGDGPVIRPAVPAEDATERRYQALLDHLRASGPAVVAFSGGVDSSFLLAAAGAALGPQVRAVLGYSPSVAQEALELALRVAGSLDVDLQVIETRELEVPEYVANGQDRCFHCKDTLFRLLERVRDSAGGRVVLDGTNADDLADIRPGLRAARLHGVRSPLAELGWTKQEIRAASRRLGLETWDRPASPCLSSRIPHGTPVTREALSRIALAERALRELGFPEVRVRHHGDLARIEVPAERIAVLAEKREEALAAVRAAGYALATVDLAGYRTGGADFAGRAGGGAGGVAGVGVGEPGAPGSGPIAGKQDPAPAADGFSETGSPVGRE